MATKQEILEALLDYQIQCNDNQRLRRMQRDWNKIIHICTFDTPADFTMTVVAGEITKIQEGLSGTPDLVVTSDSESFCDIFWGDLNPTEKYLKGEIKIKGSQEDIMRLDAITMIIWPET